MAVQSETCSNAESICQLMLARGFAACGSRDVGAFRTLASELIPGPLASVETLSAVQEVTHSSLFLKRENGVAAAFVAFFPLTESGEKAIADAVFSGVRVDLGWICAPSPELKAGYIWALGAKSPDDRVSLVRLALHLREAAFPHLRIYARGATPGGKRLMTAMGARPVSAFDPTLFCSPPRIESELDKAA